MMTIICENGHLDDQDDEEDRDDHNDHDDHDYPDDVFMVKMTNLHPTSLIAPLRNWDITVTPRPLPLTTTTWALMVMTMMMIMIMIMIMIMVMKKIMIMMMMMMIMISIMIMIMIKIMNGGDQDIGVIAMTSMMMNMRGWAKTKDHNYLHGLSLSFEILSNHQCGGVSHKTHPNPNLMKDKC